MFPLHSDYIYDFPFFFFLKTQKHKDPWLLEELD